MKLHVIHVHNLLDVRDSSREVLEVTAGQSLADLFPQPVIQRHPWGLSVNGKVIDPEHRASYFPQDGDYIVISVMPEGDNAKSVLRLVAMLAIMVVAPQLGALMGPSFFGAAGVFGLGAGAWTAIIGVTGSLLVNALLPPPKAPSNRPSSSSPTYGIDGAKNTSAEGIPVPVPYGQFRVAGNIIGNYVVNDANTQILYMLICAGEGPIASISDIEINEQPIANYLDWETEVRLGTTDQSPISWFTNTVVPVNINQEFTNAWKTYTVGTPGVDVFDAMRFDVVAPQGLFLLDNKGKYKSQSVTIEIEYRAAGTADPWLPLEVTGQITNYNTVTEWVAGVPYGGTTMTVGEVIYATDQGDNGMPVVGYITQVPVYGTTSAITITASQREALRHSYVTAPLTEGAYEIRYRRTNLPSELDTVSDKIYLSDVNKLINEKVAYINTALLALKIRLNDQLNGLPNVTFMSGGKLVKVFDETTGAWSPNLQSTANPAWIVFDILTNARYGGGAAYSRVDLPMWRDWAAWCASEGLEFHGNFDTSGNVWDAATAVARCGRGQLISRGTKYSIVVERPAEPVMMFSVANMIAGTFKESWSSMSDRANEVEVTYHDKTDSYKPHTVRLYDQQALASGYPQRVATVEIRGVVDAERAFDEAKLMLNMNRHIQRTVEFAAPIEAIACTPGDVVLVQHDMPAWGAGGLTETDSTTTLLKLDREVLMEGGKSYAVLVHYNSIQRWAGVVHSVLGDTIFLTSFDGSPKVKRLIIAGTEMAVHTVVENAGVYGVTVDDASGVTPGMGGTLYDTNVIVTAPVQNLLPPATIQEFSEVTLSAPLPSAPVKLTKWMYGESVKVSKPFRVIGINGSHEYRRDLTLVEYSEFVYDLNADHPTFNYSALKPRVVSHVTDLTVTEGSVFKDSYYETEVTVSWQFTQQTYKDAIVYLSRDGGIYQVAGSGRDKFAVIGIRGEVLEFIVVARDVNGNDAGLTGAPKVTYTVLGASSDFTGEVTGLSVTSTEIGIEVVWDAPPDLGWAFTEVRVSDWDTGTTVFKGKGTSVVLPYLPSGMFTVYVKHFGALGETATAVSASLNVLNPAVLTFLPAEKSGGSTTIRWNSGRTTQPLARHYIEVAQESILIEGATRTLDDVFGATDSGPFDQYYSCGPENDPYWDNVVLMLHGDAGFADSSNSAHVPTSTNGVAFSPGVAKFGAGSFLGTGPAVEIDYPAHADFSRADTQTIEFWIYIPTGTPSGFLGGISAGSYFQYNGSGQIVFTAMGGGSTVVSVSGVPLDSWNHVAVSYDGVYVYPFLNGISAASGTAPLGFSNNPQVFTLFGVPGRPDLVSFQGYIQEFRWTKGIARYRGNFNVPTAAFPDVLHQITAAEKGYQLTRYAVRSDIGVVPANEYNLVIFGFDNDGNVRAGTYEDGNVYVFDKDLNYVSTTTRLAGENFPNSAAGNSVPIGMIDGEPVRATIFAGSIGSVNAITVGAVNDGDPFLEDLGSFLDPDRYIVNCTTCEDGEHIFVATSVSSNGPGTQWHIIRRSGGVSSLHSEGICVSTLGTTSDVGNGVRATTGYGCSMLAADLKTLYVAYGAGSGHVGFYRINDAGELRLQANSSLLTAGRGLSEWSFVKPTIHVQGNRIVVMHKGCSQQFMHKWGSPRTVLSLHAEDLTDSSCYQPKIITLVGDAVVSTDQAKFGTSSFYCPYATDGDSGVSIALNEDFWFDWSDFTIEFWARRESNAHIGYLLWSQFCQASIGVDGLLDVVWGSVGGVQQTRSNLTSIPLGEWKFYVFQRRGLNLEVYVDGVLVDSVAATGGVNDYYRQTTLPMYLGRSYYYLDGTHKYQALNGYIDEVRITSGAARYQIKGLPIAAQFPTDAADPFWNDVVLYCPFDANVNDVKYGDTPSIVYVTSDEPATQVTGTDSVWGGGALDIYFGEASGFSNRSFKYSERAVYALADSDFTIEFYTQQPAASSANYNHVGCYSAAGVVAWRVSITNNGSLIIGGSFPGTSVSGGAGIFSFSLATAPVGVWYHVAIVRRAGIIHGFINGVLAKSSPITGSVASSGAIVLGGPWDAAWSSNTWAYGGATPNRLDEVRITKAARYAETAFDPNLPNPDVGPQNNGASLIIDPADFAAIVAGSTQSATLTFDYPGAKKIWVTAEDKGGNFGQPAFIDVDIAGNAREATASVYQWAALEPAIAGTGTYTWATNSFAGDHPSVSWALVPPAPSGGNVTLWEARVKISESDPAALTSDFDWADAIILGIGYSADGGPAGGDGNSVATVYLYKWFPTEPASPTGSSLLTWATGVHDSYDGGDGWATTVPANPGTSGLYLWIVSKSVSATAGAVSTTIAWAGSDVSSISLNGASGVQSAEVAIYIWAASIPAAPVGSCDYTWATGSFTLPGSVTGAGWSVTPGTSPTVGFTLWAGRVRLTDSANLATTSIDWSMASIVAVGYASGGGSVGRKGYAKSTNGTLSPTPTSVTTAGNATFPADATWGAIIGSWVSSPPSLVAGEYLFVTDGIYDPDTDSTYWSAPYLASLKVGALSAISANLGNITAGELNFGAFTGFAWPAAGAGNYGAHLSAQGFRMGNFNNNKYFWVTPEGDIYAPGFSIVDGNPTFGGILTAAGVVTTENIQAEAVTTNRFAAGSNSTDSSEVTVLTLGAMTFVAGDLVSVALIGSVEPGIHEIIGESSSTYEYPTIRLKRDGVIIQTLMTGGIFNYRPPRITIAKQDTPGIGTFVYSVTIECVSSGLVSASGNLLAIGVKR